MAQFLDINGLQTVVQNVKNLIKFNFLPVGYSMSNNISTSVIKNTKTTASGLILVYVTTRDRLYAYVNGYYYTQWGETTYYFSNSVYGTTNSTGVTLKNNTFLFYYVDNTLHRYEGSKMYDIVANSPTKWETVWQTGNTSKINAVTPFINSDGYVTKVERRTNENNEYIWRITISNRDGETQMWSFVRNSRPISASIELQDDEDGTMCITTPLRWVPGEISIEY